MGAKLVSVYKDNAKNFGLPVTMGTIVLHHPESGLPFAVLGGTYITALRTGAAAAWAQNTLRARIPTFCCRSAQARRDEWALR